MSRHPHTNQSRYRRRHRWLMGWALSALAGLLVAWMGYVMFGFDSTSERLAHLARVNATTQKATKSVALTAMQTSDRISSRVSTVLSAWRSNTGSSSSSGFGFGSSASAGAAGSAPSSSSPDTSLASSLISRWAMPSYPSRAPFPRDEQCLARLLGAEGNIVQEISPLTAPGEQPCGSHDPLKVRQLGGVEFASPVVMGCRSAEVLQDWLRHDVTRLSAQLELSPPTKLFHMGTYNCRRIAGSRTWSQHAFANAIDIAAFDVPELGRVALARDYLEDPTQAQNPQKAQKAKFLKKLRDSLCRRFHVVLGPEFNQAHQDHFHVDLGPYRTCR